MVKIISGEFRSRRLHTPDDDSISRLYGSRVKESVFNLLRGWFEGATVLDLFAGVGTMGLEAVSRGAANVFLVEKDPRIFRLLEKNIDNLKCGDRATAVLGDAMGPVCLARAPRPADVVFVDPPYAMMEDDRARRHVLEQVALYRELMNDRGFMVLRSPVGQHEAELSISGFAGPEEHKYGKEMNVLLYAPSVASRTIDPR
ncbi:MAG: 16S rRNA (guanine(966)-N(2))-methyltransferase RsmD [Phycisphaerales bacterium]|nr:16S rRNA (guanine(966)-N(2))-methyltransferase RsmD [Phycisphaerales bacterium]